MNCLKPSLPAYMPCRRGKKKQRAKRHFAQVSRSPKKKKNLGPFHNASKAANSLCGSPSDVQAALAQGTDGIATYAHRHFALASDDAPVFAPMTMQFLAQFHKGILPGPVGIFTAHFISWNHCHAQACCIIVCTVHDTWLKSQSCHRHFACVGSRHERFQVGTCLPLSCRSVWLFVVSHQLLPVSPLHPAARQAYPPFQALPTGSVPLQ